MNYFDYAATTPMSAIALKVYLETAEKYYGNPSSNHPIGQAAQQLLSHCRQVFSELVEKPAESLIFTSGGTESNQLALALSLKLLPKKDVKCWSARLNIPHYFMLWPLIQRFG